MVENKLSRILNLLDEAEILAGEFSGGYSNRFISAEQFHDALKSSIQNLKSSDLNEIKTLSIYFSPTGSWDDLIGKEGQNLANEIYDLLKSIEEGDI